MGLQQDGMGLLWEWLVGRIAYVEVQGSAPGPVLLNLFSSPFLENTSGPAYADDSYHITISECKQDAVRTLQERIIESESWLAGSG